MKYERDARFDTYYLEDSYVLGLDESEPSRLTFSLALVLTPKHPLYVAPSPHEQYCFRNGDLAFEGITALDWVERHFNPSTDADGQIDYGNIDVFTIGPEGRYFVEGDWGRVALTAKFARITVS
jgi:hypothetical protein